MSFHVWSMAGRTVRAIASAALLALAVRAGAELPATPEPSRAWTDLYFEAVGWERVDGAPLERDLVPTLRARALYALPAPVDVSAYFVAQLTRDLASTIGTRSRLYADNRALLGAGLLLRTWDGKLGLFAQAGPAFDLMGAGRETELDARGGAYLAVESPRCWPRRSAGLELRLEPCAELYSEGVWLRRFEDDVVGVARGRLGATLLVTGPVAWGVVGQLRAATDRNRDYYDNFVEGGGGLRVKLLAPFHLDVIASVETGTYFDRLGRDPAPSSLRYTEFRLLAATYLEARR
jgi:hypothetical protein